MLLPVRTLLLSLLVTAVVLSGCSGGGNGGGAGGNGEANPEAAPEVEVTETTGGIRGVVVDEAIRPIEGAAIQVATPDALLNVTSNEQGLFALSGLEEGTYLVKASHGLYSEVQQTVEVKAGVKEPPALKLQLTRTVFSTPYRETLVFDGFIACSQDFDGSLFSEECGQGAGVPEDSCFLINHPPQCVDNPIMPGERVGRQDSNKVQYDFFPAVDDPKSLIVEVNWKPTIGVATSGTLWTVVATNFVCDPFCGGENVMNYGGEYFGNCASSPSYIRQNDNLAELNLTTETKISTFTWACGSGDVGYDIQINQKFQEFVTLSYYLPLPEEWSFVAGSPDPFK